jgi:hypothetical protein
MQTISICRNSLAAKGALYIKKNPENELNTMDIPRSLRILSGNVQSASGLDGT